VLKVICGTHNHILVEILVGHPYAWRLKPNEHALLVDMKKSQVRSTNEISHYRSIVAYGHNMHPLTAHIGVQVWRLLNNNLHIQRSLNKARYETNIEVALLSVNIVHPTSCNKYALVANSHIHWTQHSLEISLSQLSHTCAPQHFAF